VRISRPSLAAWLVVIAVTIAALLLTAPPGPGPENVPEDEFSARRAFRHVEEIARAPHPVGSEENARVRDYIVERLSEYGYVPELQNATTKPPGAIGLVNILARRSGVESTGTIAVVAHYDSVAAGPGAADDGAAVGVLLEVARLLTVREPFANDVLFLMTDGEEAGLLGAQAFLLSHPAARDVKLVLNFEARGSAGRSLMFQTSMPNEWLLHHFKVAASRPASSSLMAAVYRRMPNDTDFTIFDLAGIRGLNFAFLEDATSYHTEDDTAERLSLASLSHHGTNLTEVLTRFGDATLTAPSGGETVYFDVLGRWLVTVPSFFIWPLAGVAALLFAGLFLVARRERMVRVRGVLAGSAAHLVAIALTTLLVWLAMTALMPWLSPMMKGPVRATDLDTYLHGALVVAAAAIAAICYRFTSRRAGPVATHLGILAVWLLLAIASAALLPGGSYLFLFPLLFALVGVGWTLPFVEDRPGTAALLTAAFAIPGLVLFAPAVREFLAALGVVGAHLVFPLVALGMGLVAPLFVAGGRVSER